MQERKGLSLKLDEYGVRPVYRHIPWKETPEEGLEVKVIDTETGERVDKVYGPPPDVCHRRM